MTVLHPDDLARLTWSPGDVEIQPDLATISGQALDLSWRDAWRHELRGPHGEWIKSPVTEALRADAAALASVRTPDGNWVHDNKALEKAATGRKAGNVRLHDVVLYAKTIPVPFGLGMDLRPMEVTSLHHHWEGHGRTPSGRARRTRYTDWTLHDPETGEDFEESIKDGVSVKMFPRAQVRAAGKMHPAPPAPAPAPFPGPSFVRDPVPTTPPPVPAPAPPVPAPAVTGKHAGTVGVVSSDVIPDPAQRAAAIAEAQHGLDLQDKFVPKIAEHQKMTFSSDLGGADAQTLHGDEILIDPDISRAVGNVTKAIKGLAPDDLQKRDQGMGWWVPSDPQYSLMDTTVAHEEGHVIADKVSRKAMMSLDLWDPLAKAVGVPPPATFRDILGGHPTIDLAEWVQDHQAQLKTAVSEYGTTNLPELQAELWSEYTMNAHPRPPARIYGDYITAQLKAAGKLGEVKNAAPPPAAPVTATPKIPAAEKNRLESLWTNSYRYADKSFYTGSNFAAADVQRGKDFADELHRLLTANTPPAPDAPPGAQDAHKFLAMVEQDATVHAGGIARGIGLSTADAERMFKTGATLDLPVASWTGKPAKSAANFSKYFRSGTQMKVILHTAPGAKGMDIDPGSTGNAAIANMEREVVTGGRYSVDKVQTAGKIMNVYLTQRDFSAH